MDSSALSAVKARRLFTAGDEPAPSRASTLRLRDKKSLGESSSCPAIMPCVVRAGNPLFGDHDLPIVFKDTVLATLAALVAGMSARAFDLAGATALTAGQVSEP